MNKKLCLLIFTTVIMFLQFGCSSEQMKQQLNVLPNATGSVDEVLLLMKDDLWKDAAGDTIRKYLQEEYLVLPQSEPIFDLVQVGTYNNLAGLLKRSAIVVVVGSMDSPSHSITNLVQEQVNTFEQAGKTVSNLFARKNLWAEPQRVIFVKADTKEALPQVLSEKMQKIKSQIYAEANKKVLATALVSGSNEAHQQEVFDKFGLNTKIPTNYNVALNNDSIMWFRYDRNNLGEEICNLIFYKTDTPSSFKELNQALPVVLRNQLGNIVKTNTQGSSMIVESKLPPFQQMTSFKQLRTVETRGLWRMSKDFLGGPFVNYLFQTPNKKQLIMVDAFVFAPKGDKRNLMRELEMLIQTANK